MIKVINIKQGNKSVRPHPLDHYYGKKDPERINFGVYHIRIGMLLLSSYIYKEIVCALLLRFSCKLKGFVSLACSLRRILASFLNCIYYLYSMKRIYRDIQTVPRHRSMPPQVIILKVPKVVYPTTNMLLL